MKRSLEQKEISVEIMILTFIWLYGTGKEVGEDQT